VHSLFINFSLVLTVQFSSAVFNGSESSGVVTVTLVLIGGTASEDIYVTVTPVSASATGKSGTTHRACV